MSADLQQARRAIVQQLDTMPAKRRASWAAALEELTLAELAAGLGIRNAFEAHAARARQLLEPVAQETST
jgi:DNA-directed RNA polymerase specialized sigma24 family protein